MLWLILFILLIVLLIIKIYKSYNYWQYRGVTHIKVWPKTSGGITNIFKRRAITERIDILYREYPNAKYIGLVQFGQPLLLVREPEIIKQITVKDFSSFMDHRAFLKEDIEPIIGKNLVSLKGQKWKDMRSTLSPAFTSNKLKTMYVLITECAEQFTNYFLKEAQKENGMVSVEMKDIFTRYTNDVIATTAFGIQCDSLQYKENEFYMAGKKSTDFGIWTLLKITALLIAPRIMKYVGLTAFDKKATALFYDLIINTINIRKNKNIIRPDMIHLLMQAQQGNLKQEATSEDAGFATVEESEIGLTQKENKPVLTDEDIVAQAFIFFFAGYDSASTAISFMAYEMALNPEIQTKLQKEIDEIVSKSKLDYENILKMKYLDMVISETLRKWPPGFLLDRICEKPCKINLPNDNESAPVIEQGTSIWIPVFSIHHDEKYFTNPEQFDPERFNDENKQNIAPFTYMPFGVGPRNCIASRFALLEIKILFAHLLSKFEFKVIEKTQIPIKFNKNRFNLATENGIWLGMKPRYIEE